jgi:hypothetical protein
VASAPWPEAGGLQFDPSQARIIFERLGDFAWGFLHAAICSCLLAFGRVACRCLLVFGKDMTEDITKQVYQALLARSKNGTLGKKDTRIVADQFGVHIRSVQRLWKRGKS